MKSTIFKLLVIFIYFILPITIFAQIENNLAQGYRFFKNQNYFEAISTYKAILGTEPENQKALYYLGISLLKTNQAQEAQQYWDSLSRVAPHEFEDFEFWSGKSYYLNHKFHESYEHLESYLQTGKNRKQLKECKELISFVKNGIQLSRIENNTKIEHINQQINSEQAEFGAVASQSGKDLIFTRQNQPLETPSKRKKRGAKKRIFISKMRSDDTWNTAIRIKNRNTSSGYDVAIQLLDADRRLLIYQDGDLKISQFRDGEWKIPKLLDKGINTSKTEKFACVYDNGNRIIFSSNHGRGKSLDLYQSTLDKNGKWTKPRPLTEINTSKDEDSPYITNGGKTLYFSSKGHQSIGGYDIFQSNFNMATRRWGKPKNLGLPINSVKDDLYFSKINEVGYLTSDRTGGFGLTDIYRFYTFSKVTVTGKVIYRKNTKPCKGCVLRFESSKKAYEVTTDTKGFYKIELPFHIPLKTTVSRNSRTFYKETNILTINLKRPKFQHRNYYIGYDSLQKKQLNIEGIIQDKMTNESLSASLQLMEWNTDNIVKKYRSNSFGKYQIVIDNESQKYRLEVQQIGYFYATQAFDTDTIWKDKIQLDFKLLPLKLKQIFILKDVFFESGSDILTDKSFEELNRLSQFLEQNSSVRIEVSGHTDNIGEAGTNLYLSDKRAKAVKNYLVGKGIISSRLEAIGYGDTRPIASNDDEEDGRELNRRIEIQILEI